MSEETLSSGGEQGSYQEDPAMLVPSYYMMHTANGVGGANGEGLITSAPPSTVWGGSSEQDGKE